MYDRYAKLALAIILTLSLLISAPFMSLAHSGRTDSSGGHRDNRNASGLGYYHYHHGMGPHLHPNGICPYSINYVNNNAANITYNQSSIINNTSYSTSIYDQKISRPYFNVTINSTYCNYTSSQYYPVDIGGIVFVPLTSEMLFIPEISKNLLTQ